jgi:flagellin
MRELATQSSNDTNTGTDRGELQKEFNQLAKEITRISDTTEFNSQKLLDGSDGDGKVFQIGANAGQSLTLTISDMSASALLVGTGTNETDTVGVDITTQANANTAITLVNDAIETVSAERSKLGATQNRLEHTINNLSTSSENLTAAESRIRDTDMAKTMMDQTKNSILSQAAQAMLAQANQQPQGVLQLLR